MKAIKAGTILENAARLAGRHVGLGIPEDWKILAQMSLNAGLTRLTGEKFPMMQRVEFRRYRPTFDPSVDYAVGNEVFFNEHYWRKERAGVGTPGEAECWRELKANEVAAFIAWQQPWENTIIDRAGADPTRFAYTADPKYNPNATPIRATRVTSFGIELEAPAPLGVFIVFVPEFPTIAFTAEEGPWEAGDTYYDKMTKDVYYAVRDTSETPAAGAADWVPIRIPGEFETYLTRLVATDFLTLDQGKQQSQGRAEAEFDRLCEQFHDGHGEANVRHGRFI